MAKSNLFESIPCTVRVWTTATTPQSWDGHVLAVAVFSYNNRSGNVRCQVEIHREIPGDGPAICRLSPVKSAGGGGYDKHGTSLLGAWRAGFPQYPACDVGGVAIRDGAVGVQAVVDGIGRSLEKMYGLPKGSVQDRRVL